MLPTTAPITARGTLRCGSEGYLKIYTDVATGTKADRPQWKYEAALIRERTQAELIDKAQRMYDARTFTMAEIVASYAVTPMTIYRNIRTGEPTPR